MMNPRTDLAHEAYEMLMEAAWEISGVSTKEESAGDIRITRVDIETNEAAEKMGKAAGGYITIDIPDTTVMDKEKRQQICRILSKEIKNLAKLSDDASVLIVGLGNRFVTPDALGPEVVSSLVVTRHIFEYLPEYTAAGMRPVCAIAPGVLGITGMETGEIVRGITDKIKPDLIICIDALASRSTERISRTIQLSDTGIAPGAGVGNKRHALNEETLGVPVIAIGVPTVIDAATITADALGTVTESIKKLKGENDSLYKLLSSIDEDDRTALVRDVLTPESGNFMVTPKDIDMVIEKVAKLVADGINLSLHEDFDFEDIEAYVS